MLKLISDLAKSNEDDLSSRVIEGPSLANQDLHALSQLRGQILALREVLNIKEYLIELIEDGETSNEISSTRSEGSTESSQDS